MHRVVFAALVGCALLVVPPARCRAQDDVESSRKLVLKVPPHYPELARTIKLSGAVRMLVTVAPNGTVKNIKILGGSPVLAQAAEDAVEKWKWVAAPTETKVPVEINFRSD